MIAAELANLGRGGDRRSEDFKAQICAVSDAQAATLLNVSERSVARAKAVKREAIPEVIKLVEDGKLAVSAAASVAKLAKDPQNE